MRAAIYQANAAGKLPQVGARGIGFQLVPAVPAGAAPGVRPGNFPVTVRLRGKGGGYVGEPFDVVGPGSHWVAAEGGEFSSFDVEGADAADSWLVVTLETKADGVIPGSKSRVTSRVQGATELPTAAPALATDGWPIRPGTLSHDFYFSGALGDVEVWQRSRGGTWADTGQLIDATTEFVAHRSVLTGADRIALVAAGAGLLCEVDVTQEVG